MFTLEKILHSVKACLDILTLKSNVYTFTLVREHENERFCDVDLTFENNVMFGNINGRKTDLLVI